MSQRPQRPGPIGGDMAAIVFGLARRARLPTLVERHSSTLVLGLFAGTLAVAGGLFRRHGVGEGAGKRIAAPLGRRQAVVFAYPTDDDPALAVRLDDGTLVAYSSVCTHLACGVLYRPGEGDLYCPCHEGRFDPRTGEPVAGPPTRALPPVRLDERPDGIWAIGAGP